MVTGIILAAPLGVVVKLLRLLTLQPTGIGVLAHTRLFSHRCPWVLSLFLPKERIRIFLLVQARRLSVLLQMRNCVGFISFFLKTRKICKSFDSSLSRPVKYKSYCIS